MRQLTWVSAVFVTCVAANPSFAVGEPRPLPEIAHSVSVSASLVSTPNTPQILKLPSQSTENSILASSVSSPSANLTVVGSPEAASVPQPPENAVPVLPPIPKPDSVKVITSEKSKPTPPVVVVSEKQKVIEAYIKRHHPKILKQNATAIAAAVIKESKAQGIDPYLVAAIIAVESGFNHTAHSRSGIKGLGQIVNYNRVNIRDPYNIDQAVRGTALMIKQLLQLWKGNPQQLSRTIASYQRGYGVVRRRGMTRGSQRYVNWVMAKYNVMQHMQAGSKS